MRAKAANEQNLHWKPQHRVSRTPGVGLHVRRIPSELSATLPLQDCGSVARDPPRGSRHMPSDDGQIRPGVSESPDDRSRFSEDCTDPGGRRRVLSRRIAGFSCRRQEICFAGLASRGLRKSDAYAGAAGGVCGGGAGDFLADSWPLGKDGTHAYSPGGGERGRTDGRSPNGVETAYCEERKVLQEKAPWCAAQR